MFTQHMSPWGVYTETQKSKIDNMAFQSEKELNMTKQNFMVCITKKNIFHVIYLIEILAFGVHE